MKNRLKQVPGEDLNKHELSNLRGGTEEYPCCKLICFEQLFQCDKTGTYDCEGVYNPDPDNCYVEGPIPCSECPPPA